LYYDQKQFGSAILL